MADFRLEVQGFADLERKLQELPAKLSKKAARKGLRAGAKIVADRAKQLVPTDTGRLRRSIKVRAGQRSRKNISVLVLTGTREELGIPASARGYYPMAIEAGSSKTPAQPYMRPAVRSEQGRAFRKIGEVTGEELEKEAAKGV